MDQAENSIEQRGDAPLMEGNHDRRALELLERVRKIIATHTRFKREEAQLASSSTTLQGFSIEASHALSGRVATWGINGNFSANEADIQTRSQGAGASRDVEEIMRGALSKLAREAADPARAYDALGSGAYLGHARSHWSLSTCSPCSGEGKTTCSSCHGRGEDSCASCSGRGKKDCSTCYGIGDTMCHMCTGTGTRMEMKAYTVTVGVYVNGHYQNETQTQYRNESVICTSCNFGRLTCNTCFGNRQVNCISCSGSGQVSCSRCNGRGNVTCSTCSSTGKSGLAARAQADIATQRALVLPNGPDELSIEAVAVLGMEGTASAAEYLSLADCHREADNPSLCFRVCYEGKLAVARADIQCGGKTFSVAAYGKELTWIRIGHIAEQLMADDLSLLEHALGAARTTSLFELDPTPVAIAFKNALASSLHEKLAAGAEQETEGPGTVSADFAKRVETRSRQAQTALAKGVAGPMVRKDFPRAAVAVLAAWAALGSLTAGSVALGFAIWSTFMFRRRLRAILFNVFPTKEGAQRSWDFVIGEAEGRKAAAILLAPMAGLVLAAWILMPKPNLQDYFHQVMRRAESHAEATPSASRWMVQAVVSNGAPIPGAGSNRI